MTYQDDWTEIQADPRFQAAPPAKQATYARYYARLIVRPEAGANSKGLADFIEKNVAARQPVQVPTPEAYDAFTPPIQPGQSRLADLYQQGRDRQIPANLQPQTTPAQMATDLYRGAMEAPTGAQQAIAPKAAPTSRHIPYNTPALNPDQQRLDLANQAIETGRGATYGPLADAYQGALDLARSNAITPAQPMGFPGSDQGVAEALRQTLPNAIGQTAAGFMDPDTQVAMAALAPLFHPVKSLRAAARLPSELGGPTLGERPPERPGDALPYGQFGTPEALPAPGPQHGIGTDGLPIRATGTKMRTQPNGLPPGVNLGEVIEPESIDGYPTNPGTAPHPAPVNPGGLSPDAAAVIDHQTMFGPGDVAAEQSRRANPATDHEPMLDHAPEIHPEAWQQAVEGDTTRLQRRIQDAVGQASEQVKSQGQGDLQRQMQAAHDAAKWEPWNQVIDRSAQEPQRQNALRSQEIVAEARQNYAHQESLNDEAYNHPEAVDKRNEARAREIVAEQQQKRDALAGSQYADRAIAEHRARRGSNRRQAEAAASDIHPEAWQEAISAPDTPAEGTPPLFPHSLADIADHLHRTGTEQLKRARQTYPMGINGGGYRDLVEGYARVTASRMILGTVDRAQWVKEMAHRGSGIASGHLAHVWNRAHEIAVAMFKHVREGFPMRRMVKGAISYEPGRFEYMGNRQLHPDLFDRAAENVATHLANKTFDQEKWANDIKKNGLYSYTLSGTEREAILYEATLRQRAYKHLKHLQSKRPPINGGLPNLLADEGPSGGNPSSSSTHQLPGGSGELTPNLAWNDGPEQPRSRKLKGYDLVDHIARVYKEEADRKYDVLVKRLRAHVDMAGDGTPKGGRGGFYRIPDLSDVQRAGKATLDVAARVGKRVGDIQRLIERKTLDPVDRAIERKIVDLANKVTGQHHADFESVWEYLKHEPSNTPAANMLRARIVSDFGVPLPVVEMRREARRATERAFKPIERHANVLEKLDPHARAELDRQVSEPTLLPRSRQAEAIAGMVDDLSQQKVDVGALSQEAFDKHKGFYLPRAYEDKVPVVSNLVRAFGNLTARINGYQERGRKFNMTKGEWDGRTRDWRTTGQHAMGITELRDGTGAKVYVKDADVPHYTSPWTFRGYAGKWGVKAVQAEREAEALTDRMAQAHAKGWSQRAIDAIQDQLDEANGRFLDAREKAIHVGHRDYSLAEREGKMMQERDIARSLYRFIDKERANLEGGKFLQMISQDSRYALRNGKGMTPPADWVLFGNEKATGGGPGTEPRKWGALANHWVEPETAAYLGAQAGWKNFVREFKRYSGINVWKGNKTVGNGPTYMLNNFMQNMPFLMLEGGTPWDIPAAIKHTVDRSTLFQALEENGTIRDGRQLADLGIAMNAHKTTAFSPYALIKSTWGAVQGLGAKLGNIAQTTDDLFRIALVDRKMQEGMGFEEASKLAEKTFYNPQSVTSDIATAHEAVSPFVKFWYWSADRMPVMMVKHAAKAAAMLGVWQAGRSFSDFLAGRSGADIEAREANLPSNLKGGIGSHGWFNPNSFPMPWNDRNGNQVVLGTHAWNPGQFAADTAEQQKLGLVPQAWMPGGPHTIAYNALTNHDPFYGQDIAKATDGPWDFPRARYLASNLGPSYLSSTLPIVGDAIRGRQSYTGQQYDVPTALPRLLGFKTQPFDQDARAQQLTGQQGHAIQEIRSALHRAAVMQGRNPGDSQYWQGEIDRLTDLLSRTSQTNAENLQRAIGSAPSTPTPALTGGGFR